MSFDTYNQAPKNSGNRIASASDGALILPGHTPLPPVYLRGEKVSPPFEDTIKITSTKVFQPYDLSSILSRRRYFKVIWLYGIASFSTGTPTANANPFYWGFSSATLANQTLPWAGVYGGEIALPGGRIFDLSWLWVQGSVNDSIFISAFP